MPNLTMLTREAVLKALGAIDNGEILKPKNRKSKNYCLVYQGKHYPPKFVISIGWLMQFGYELSPDTFWGGGQTNNALRRLEFRIVKCHCGGDP